ncbi:WD40 repeat domain-containing protein [Roseiconus nitratireducens]|uniref:WD40 repeat domain-containing protein n=1 Tax=Roseiconus nitratireducens TaxID=2605748 RepID=A0A5M6D244_9BACT|nr:WD40 repeat domain-containing protein [Roseiconus nitratireducens]KAA5541076.1 WD40 repeat domain-containing protein [Roseiconus nitratireducens]
MPTERVPKGVTAERFRGAAALPMLVAVLATTLTLSARSAEGRQPPLTALVIAPDGRSVVAGSQDGIQVYSWPELQFQRTIATQAVNLQALAFSPRGDRLAIGGGLPAEQGLVEVISWPDGQRLRTFRKHEDSVMAVAWKDATTLASGGLDHRVFLWSLSATSETPPLRLAGHSRGVTSLCFIDHGKLLVTAGLDQSVRVWDTQDGSLRRTLAIHTQPVRALVPLTSPQGTLPLVVSASDDRTLRLWQPTIGRMVRLVKLDQPPLNVIGLREGATMAAACADGRVYFVDTATVRVIGSVPAIDGWPYAMAESPDDDALIIAGEDGQIRRVDLPVLE